MQEQGALDRFATRLDPAVVDDIRSWTDDHPLAKLRAGLDGHEELRTFLDTYAEAVVGRHLLDRGCRLRFEVPTPNGKAADFEVEAGDQRFFLHVKRLETGRPVRRRLTISSRLRNLERIERPYHVSVRWHEGATDAEMQRLVRAASKFILQARVGDELVVKDDHGREIGGVLIVAPWEGTHVSLTIGLPTGFIDDAPRMRKLLRRAYRQFMPKAENVILIASSRDSDHEDFESALLGAHVERWDAFPPRGRRIAHGRADDGFWQGSRYSESRVAGWLRLAPGDERTRIRLGLRADRPIDEPLVAALRRVLTAPEEPVVLT